MRSLKKHMLVALVLFGLSAGLLISVASALPLAGGGANVKSCNSAGIAKDTFGVGENVYACGTDYNLNEIVTVRVVPNNQPLSSLTSIRNVAAQADNTGDLGPVNLGTFSIGKYDIWVDRDSDGWVDPNEPVDAYTCPVGFLVVPELWLGTILGVASCFAGLGAFGILKRKRF